MSLPFTAISPFPQERKSEVDQLLAQSIQKSGRIIVVLDDDPTGVQTVHGVSVYTDWEPATLNQAFKQEDKLFFILTNSRGFTAVQTKQVHRVIVPRLVNAAKESGRDFMLVSRSDSTLRGHYPLETEVLRREMEQYGGISVDGEILCPYFGEGGRYTIGNVHYVHDGDSLIPAARTEFAHDPTFRYTHSDLREYVNEKTEGRFPAETVACVSLAELRALDIESVSAALEGLTGFQKLVVNATDDYDVKVFCIALYCTLEHRKQYLFRTAASFVKALAGITDRKPLTHHELVGAGTARGGLVVVGSHTSKTTRQLEALLTLPNIKPIALNTNLVLQSGALEQEVTHATIACNKLIRSGKTPVVYTKRELLILPGDTPSKTLARSVRISEAVQAVVAGLGERPAFLIAKGGITSSDIGTKALRVRRATVLGQIYPGIPVWQTGNESKYPHLPFIIFPGNVGQPDTLRWIVALLTGEPATQV